jgi:nucleotide-binding universal stress UspA family protein
MIMSSKPIVVGADGSEQALYAVEWAALERFAAACHCGSCPYP